VKPLVGLASSPNVINAGRGTNRGALGPSSAMLLIHCPNGDENIALESGE
jgi:hypothetical protein